jgi:hypothetical protein
MAPSNDDRSAVNAIVAIAVVCLIAFLIVDRNKERERRRAAEELAAGQSQLQQQYLNDSLSRMNEELERQKCLDHMRLVFTPAPLPVIEGLPLPPPDDPRPREMYFSMVCSDPQSPMRRRIRP